MLTLRDYENQVYPKFGRKRGFIRNKKCKKPYSKTLISGFSGKRELAEILKYNSKRNFVAPRFDDNGKMINENEFRRSLIRIRGIDSDVSFDGRRMVFFGNPELLDGRSMYGAIESIASDSNFKTSDDMLVGMYHMSAARFCGSFNETLDAFDDMNTIKKTLYDGTEVEKKSIATIVQEQILKKIGVNNNTTTSEGYIKWKSAKYPESLRVLSDRPTLQCEPDPCYNYGYASFNDEGTPNPSTNFSYPGIQEGINQLGIKMAQARESANEQEMEEFGLPDINFDLKKV